MNQLSVYMFEDNVSIRTVPYQDFISFCLVDCLKALNSTTQPSDTKKAIVEVFGDEVVINYPISDSLGRMQDTTFITEVGLTFLISRSRTEVGKRFAKWIHNEILPSIRKTGLFNTVPFKLSQDSSLVSFEHDDYWVQSISIAEVFSKRHDNVLRDLELAIEDLLKFEEMSEDLPNFKLIETTYLDNYNRTTKCYKVNRSLFNYVVLAYQGDNAKLYRMKFIQAFDELEKQVKVFLSQQLIYSNPKRQQVYILQNSISGMVKIGITNDIHRRIAELQNASGCEINVLYLSPKTDNASEIEQSLHKQFKEYRGIGEWFNLPPNFVIKSLVDKELIINTHNVNSKLILKTN